jgi:transposase
MIGGTTDEHSMRLSAQTISLKEYLKRAREGGGPEALRRRKAPGATPCLTLTQRAGIAHLLERHAAARVRLERLPGYAPDLNPDEGIWNYLKRVELKRVYCRDLPHLRGELTKAIKRLRHKSRIIRGCINQTSLISC